MNDYKDLWIKVLNEVFPIFGRAHTVTYFNNTAILWIEDWNIIIWVPRPMCLNWHLEHSRDTIFQIIKKFKPEIEEVIFKIDWNLENNDPRAIETSKIFSKNKWRKLPRKKEVRLANWITSKILNPKYRLWNFVIWENNKMAHAVAEAVAKKPWDKYNPFFIYWNTWLWKTHLLQAIWNEIVINDPESIVIYVTSEMFINEVVEGIWKRAMEKLRKKYRQVDVLIIDDVQFLMWKERTMEEFFHTFNTLYENWKQIIIASDRPPKELEWMESRLVSRFESWMTADLKMPDYETRLAILYDKAQNYHSLIPWDIFEFIAMNVTSSIRELEWVLMQVAAIVELQHRTPTLKDVWNFIKQINKEAKLVWFEEKKPVLIKTMEDVVSYTSDHFEINISDILWPKRTKDIMYPRQMAMYICKENLGQSLMKIWEHFWWRDHTSVMHSVKKIELALKDKDPQVKRDVKELYRQMGVM